MQLEISVDEVLEQYLADETSLICSSGSCYPRYDTCRYDDISYSSIISVGRQYYKVGSYQMTASTTKCVIYSTKNENAYRRKIWCKKVEVLLIYCAIQTVLCRHVIRL